MKQHFLGRITEVLLPPSGDVQFGEGREVFDPSDEAPCSLHGDFRPERRLDTMPRAPQCPQCVAEELRRRRPDETVSEPLEVVDPRNARAYMGGQDPERVAKATEAYNARQAARSGGCVSGSAEEQLALEIIAARREEEQDAASRRKGRVCVERIESCRIVQYVAHRGRRGLSRVEL